MIAMCLPARMVSALPGVSGSSYMAPIEHRGIATPDQRILDRTLCVVVDGGVEHVAQLLLHPSVPLPPFPE
jgi:hypothetical protein